MNCMIVKVKIMIMTVHFATLFISPLGTLLMEKSFCKVLEIKPCILLDRTCRISTSITVFVQMPKNAEFLVFFHNTKIIFQFGLTTNIWVKVTKIMPFTQQLQEGC